MGEGLQTPGSDQKCLKEVPYVRTRKKSVGKRRKMRKRNGDGGWEKYRDSGGGSA